MAEPGFPTYWVVHRGGAEVFTDPSEDGYRQVNCVDSSGRIDVPYAPVALELGELLEADG